MAEGGKTTAERFDDVRATHGERAREPAVCVFLVLDPRSLPVTPRYPEVRMDHLTLAFAVRLTPEIAEMHGRRTSLRLTGLHWNEKIEALGVSLDGPRNEDLRRLAERHRADSIEDAARSPHITVSSVPDVGAVASNAMLAGPHRSRPLDVVLPARVECLLHRPPKERELPFLDAAGLALRTLDDYKAAVAALRPPARMERPAPEQTPER